MLLLCANVQLQSGTSGYWSLRRSIRIPSFDFSEHLIDVSSGERVLRSTSNRLQLRFGFDNGAARARFAKRPANPFTYCQTFSPGHALDFRHLLVGKQDLKPLTHIVSIAWSPKEYRS